MTIKQKILVSLLLVLGASLLLNFLVFDRIVTPAFDALEVRTAESNARRAANAIRSEVQRVSVTAFDWASWDDTYSYVLDQNPDYARSNLVDSTFAIIPINLLFIFDAQGNRIWGRSVALPEVTAIQLDRFEPELDEDLRDLLRHRSKEDHHEGVIRTSRGPMLIAAYPILTSADRGPIRGTLIMGRLLDAKLLARVREITDVQLSILPVRAGDRGGSSIPNPGEIELQRENSGFVSAFSTLGDFKARPTYWLRVDTPTEITALGIRATEFALLTLLVVSMIIILTLSIIFTRVVFRPMEALTDHIVSIRRFVDLSKRHASGRADEIGALGTEFDSLLDRLQDTQGKLLSDFESAQSLSEELAYQATHDALTDLTNRREFETRLERVLDTAKTQHSQHAVCFLDLDQFKFINDTCGHVAGDQLLISLAAELKAKVRKRDTLARIGGDEFAVLLEHCSLRQAERVAENLLSTVDKFRFEWDERRLQVGVSIGVVPISETSGDIADVLQAADAACYAAKHQGRNRVEVFRGFDEAFAKRQGEIQWAARVNDRLESGDLNLVCQPIQAVTPVTGSGDFFELLVRLRDDNGRLVPAKTFLPGLERFALAQKMDRWVMRTTFDHFAGNTEALNKLFLCSINLSSDAISDDQFLDFVESLFADGRVPPKRICFEITESAAIADLGGARRFIARMKELGCHFALDDFGTGLSSFAYLKTLPVDFVKIDGAFVRECANDPVSLSMVKAINEIGKIMGMQTVAEFVENRMVFEKLREIGVDFVQGDFVGRPLPLRKADAEVIT